MLKLFLSRAAGEILAKRRPHIGSLQFSEPEQLAIPETAVEAYGHHYYLLSVSCTSQRHVSLGFPCSFPPTCHDCKWTERKLLSLRGSRIPSLCLHYGCIYCRHLVRVIAYADEGVQQFIFIETFPLSCHIIYRVRLLLNVFCQRVQRLTPLLLLHNQCVASRNIIKLYYSRLRQRPSKRTYSCWFIGRNG